MAKSFYQVATRDAEGNAILFRVRNKESFQAAMEEVSVAMHEDGVAHPIVLASVSPVIEE